MAHWDVTQGLWSCAGAHGSHKDTEGCRGDAGDTVARAGCPFPPVPQGCCRLPSPSAGLFPSAPSKPQWATGSLFLSCAKSSSVDKEQGLPSCAGPQLCPPALAQRGWIPAWPPAQTPHSALRLEGRAGNQPRSQSQRLEWLCHLRGTKAFSALGQYCHSPAVPPASGARGQLLRAAFQLHYRAPLPPSLKLRLFFRFLLPLKPPRALWRRGESFPRKLQGGDRSPVGTEGSGGSSLAPPACPVCPHGSPTEQLRPRQDPQRVLGRLTRLWSQESGMYCGGVCPPRTSVPITHQCGGTAAA